MGDWVLAAVGLSPRVRGKHPAIAPRKSGIGPIPAGAGETTQAIAPTYYPWAYPRGCGGNGYCSTVHKFQGGLSPRVRGKLIRWVGIHTKDGLSPRVRGKRPRQA